MFLPRGSQRCWKREVEQPNQVDGYERPAHISDQRQPAERQRKGRQGHGCDTSRWGPQEDRANQASAGEAPESKHGV